MNICSVLDKKKVKYGYETIKLDYVIEGRYKPDIILDNGTIIELKGYFSAQDRKKLVAVKKNNPDIDLRIVFMVDNLLTKKSKMRYTDWACKNNIPSAVGAIPLSWLDPPKK